MPEPAVQHATPPAGVTIHILHPLATSTLCGARIHGKAIVLRHRAHEATCKLCLQQQASSAGCFT